MRPDDGGGSSNYSSIQFSGMQSLISEVRAAGSTLQDTTRGLQSTATGCGVSSPAFAQIIEIGAWAESQVAGLERRLTLAQGAAKAIDPGLTGWTIDEPVDMTAAEAAKKGQALAQRIIDHNSTDSDFIKITDDTLDELELYEGDPDVLSAFYATLGPRETQAMPALLEGSGAQDSTQLEKLSRTFALAFNDPDPPAGFTEVTDVFKSSTGHEPDPTNWDRLAMLQWGQFPPDFVADVVKANGLEKFASDDDEVDWRGNMGGSLGLDEDVRTLIFGAMKNNPEATRDAFTGLDLDKVVDRTYAEGDFNFELQQNFIAAMKAGSGVDDETMGDHSYAASQFAFDFIRASGSNEDVPDLWTTKEGLASIAASYAPELVAGANTKDAYGRESSFLRPENYDVPPGIDPAFYLNAEDIYKYLHGFADQDERFDPPHDYSDPFDDAVTELYNTSLVKAARELKEHPNSDTWTDTLRIYGNLSGLHLQAQTDVRHGQDAADQAAKDLMAGIMNKGVALIPGGAEAGLLVKGGIKVFKFAAKEGIKSWRETDPETTREALLHDSEVQASFLTDYQLLNALKTADYPGTDKIPPQLLDGDHLKSPGAIAKDPDLIGQYQQWIDSTDSPKATDLDSLTETEEFNGGLYKGKTYGEGYGW